MPLPGDRDIDTDPTDDPDRLDIILDVCDHTEEQMSALQDVYAVLSDEEASEEAQALAMRTLRVATRHFSLDPIRRRATRLQEEVGTLTEQLNAPDA